MCSLWVAYGLTMRMKIYLQVHVHELRARKNNINNSLSTRKETANDRLRSSSQATTHKTLGCIASES